MKKFKTKRINYKGIILIILFFILFIIISFFKLDKSNRKIVDLLTNNFNNTSYLSLNLLTSNLDNLISSHHFKESNQVLKTISKKIYLYNTHNLEKYNDGTPITSVSTLLKDNLTKLGFNVILEEKKTSDLLHTGLSYYEISRSFLKDVMYQEKDINYYIDIHRDSVKDTKIMINNKSYAKIMFVLGLENKNYELNKKVITKMNNYLNENYPGLSKGILEKKGSGVDGVYNQDLSENVILIEIGGIDNNLEEINNSTEIISLMLYYILGD